MTDSDLRRWLRLQTRDAVGLVAHATVRRGPPEIARALADCGQRGERLVIVDAVEEGDLRAIGEACADAPLITGGSGIALGLPANFVKKSLTRAHATRGRATAGPAAVLAGSCSARTLEQIERHRASQPSLEVSPSDVLSGSVSPRHAVEFVLAHADRQPLVYSSAAPARVQEAQASHGREKVAHAIESFFAQVAEGLVKQGTKRLVIAGGETSGAVVSALRLESLEIGPEIDPGVPVLYTQGGERWALALKSGNFGGVDFFSRALQRMEAP
jgi:uncharacterized protein YgbK (DUF1537 family)